MRRQRLIWTLALVLVMALLGCGLFAACRGEQASQKSAKKSVKIAFIGPLTGPNALQGVGARNAFDLAIRQANDSGKVPYKIEVMCLDDASTPGTGVAVAQKAVMDPDVVAASGFWNSAVAEAAIPVFKSGKLALVIWAAAAEHLTSRENYPIVTRVANTTLQENEALAAFVMDKLGINKKWAIVSDTSVYGKDDTNAWKIEVGKRPGAEIVSIDEVQVGTTDFRAILTKIKQLKPEGIYFGGVVMEGALLKRQMTELGMDNILLCAISGIPVDKFIEVATPAAAEGTVAIVSGKPVEELPGGREFIEAYQKAGYKEPYSMNGANAYDAANIIVEALKKAGPDREAMIKAIAETDYSGLLGRTTFDDRGQTTRVLATLVVVQDGKWVPYDSSKYATGERKLPGTK